MVSVGCRLCLQRFRTMTPVADLVRADGVEGFPSEWRLVRVGSDTRRGEKPTATASADAPDYGSSPTKCAPFDAAAN